MEKTPKEVIIELLKTSWGKHMAKRMYDDKITAKYMDDDEILQEAIKAGFRNYPKINRPISQHIFDKIECKDDDEIYCWNCCEYISMVDHKNTAKFSLDLNHYVVVCNCCGCEVPDEEVTGYYH